MLDMHRHAIKQTELTANTSIHTDAHRCTHTHTLQVELPWLRLSPSSKHCKMLPAYDKQSGTLLANIDEADMPPFAVDVRVPIPAAAALAAPVPAVDLVVNVSGMTPRQSGIQALITPRRLQHGLWSRPPAAQRARIAKNWPDNG